MHTPPARILAIAPRRTTVRLTVLVAGQVLTVSVATADVRDPRKVLDRLREQHGQLATLDADTLTVDLADAFDRADRLREVSAWAGVTIVAVTKQRHGHSLHLGGEFAGRRLVVGGQLPEWLAARDKMQAEAVDITARGVPIR